MKEAMETQRNGNNSFDDGASTVRVTRDLRDEIPKSRYSCMSYVLFDLLFFNSVPGLWLITS